MCGRKHVSDLRSFVRFADSHCSRDSGLIYHVSRMVGWAI